MARAVTLSPRMLWAKSASLSTFFIARWLFLRSLGVVYLVAFVSLWCQVDGLIGSGGIAPAAEYLDRVGQTLAASERGNEAFWLLPTICWINADDVMLHAMCAVGVVLSVLLIIGFAPICVLMLLWIDYLSLVLVGQDFFSFQWDILLLETGFMAMFVAPAHMWPRLSGARLPSPAGLLLLRFLLFKLMFLSGITKLLSGDMTWWRLTALEVHYFTQPLPTSLAWHAHHLPAWIGGFSVAVMYIIEIIVPFFIFGSRGPRHLACAALVLLQVLIAATGNYGFFNLLAVMLCVPLLDDRLLRRLVLKRRIHDRDVACAPAIVSWRYRAGWSAAGLILLVSTLVFVREMVQTHQREGPPRKGNVLDWHGRSLQPIAQKYLLDHIDQFRTINGYGLFRTMTVRRPEIVIEGSGDGVTWKPYEFRWKPGDLNRAPPWNAPHQPRLDWQMWFAALNPRGNLHWLARLSQRLLEGSPEVLALLGDNPFPDRPPRYIRFVGYDYQFTDRQTGQQAGEWWARSEPRLLTPAMSLPIR